MLDEELQFLELSLPASDIRKSLEWYRSLGFIELATNDTRRHPYAVIGDGDFCIGLHGSDINTPALTFVRPNLANYARACMTAGQEFTQATLGIDDFHETRQSGPDSLQAILLEARTFSPSYEGEHALYAGQLHSIALPCMNVEESLAFWQRFGFIAVEAADNEQAELHAPGMVCEVSAGTRKLTLRFQPDDYDASVAALNTTHTLSMFREGALRGVELTAPEGTRIQLVQA